MCFWLCWVFVATGFSLFAESRIDSSEAHGLPIDVAFLAAERGCAGFSSCGPGLSGCGLGPQNRLKSWGTQALLPCSMWGLPGSGSALCLLHWKANSLPLNQQESLKFVLVSFLGQPSWILFYCFFSHTMQLVASYFLTRDWTQVTRPKAWSRNHWASREFPSWILGCLLSCLRNICIYVFSIFF